MDPREQVVPRHFAFRASVDDVANKSVAWLKKRGLECRPQGPEQIPDHLESAPGNEGSGRTTEQTSSQCAGPASTTLSCVDEPANIPWHTKSADEVVREQGSDARAGLSAAEAAARLARYGPNIITAKKGRPWWVRLLLQFHAPLVYILIAAGAVTLYLGEFVDTAVIFGVVLANAVIGFVQEQKAVKAIDALARSMRIEATVRRDDGRGGQRRRIDAAALVVGDIVLIEPGDKVPADLRLLDDTLKDLRVDESMLTGESKTVAKHPDVLAPESVLADRRTES